MADLTIQDIVEAGLDASYAAADAAGDAVFNVGADVVIHVRNADVSAHTVTVTAQRSSKPVAGFGAMSKADLEVGVPPGEERFIGPFPTEAFNDSTARVRLTYDAVTGVTVAALRVPRAG